MTHSLHRRGSAESLQGDYVMIARTSKVNKAARAPDLAKVAEIIFEVGVSNTGSSVLETNFPLGLDREEFVRRIPTAHGILCSFSSKEKLAEVLRRLKEADLGLSITVSGLIDEVIPLAQEMGIKPHTVNLSMGILGKTEKLAERGDPGAHHHVRPRPHRRQPGEEGDRRRGLRREDAQGGLGHDRRPLRLRHLQPGPQRPPAARAGRFHGVSKEM